MPGLPFLERTPPASQPPDAYAWRTLPIAPDLDPASPVSWRQPRYGFSVGRVG